MSCIVDYICQSPPLGSQPRQPRCRSIGILKSSRFNTMNRYCSLKPNCRRSPAFLRHAAEQTPPTLIQSGWSRASLSSIAPWKGPQPSGANELRQHFNNMAVCTMTADGSHLRRGCRSALGWQDWLNLVHVMIFCFSHRIPLAVSHSNR